MGFFDTNDWVEAFKQYDWYKRVPKLLDDLSELKTIDKVQYEKEKSRILDFLIDSLKNDKVLLGDSGKNWDSQRKPIDTIIIHHTGSEPRMSVDKLSALELIRLYAPAYANPNNEKDKNIDGKPIYSNHFSDNKMVFWPYHWIIRRDGAAERLLQDNEIGWHAGNWDVNCKSVAIVLDNDYENSSPSESELISIASIIVNDYPNISSKNVLGHCEVNPLTVCPSNNFLVEDGWKNDLLKIIEGIRKSSRSVR